MKYKRFTLALFFGLTAALVETLLLLLGTSLSAQAAQAPFLFLPVLGLCAIPAFITGAVFAMQCQPQASRGRIASRTSSACLIITFISIMLYLVAGFYINSGSTPDAATSLSGLLRNNFGNALFAALTAAFCALIVAHIVLAVTRHRPVTPPPSAT